MTGAYEVGATLPSGLFHEGREELEGRSFVKGGGVSAFDKGFIGFLSALLLGLLGTVGEPIGCGVGEDGLLGVTDNRFMVGDK